MLSKIMLDLDETNNPCIVVSVAVTSDDIRDKIANRFIGPLKINPIILAKEIGVDMKDRLTWELKVANEEYYTKKDLVRLVQKILADDQSKTLSITDLVDKHL